MNARWDQFAPRVGFALQINPKTVLRGGWGLFYSPENDAREDLLTKNFPFAIQQQWNNIPYNGPCTVPPQSACTEATTTRSIRVHRGSKPSLFPREPAVSQHLPFQL